MAIRKLRFEDDPILRKKAKTVPQIDHLDGILFTDLAEEYIIPDL